MSDENENQEFKTQDIEKTRNYLTKEINQLVNAFSFLFFLV